jgi:hypothetical protein
MLTVHAARYLTARLSDNGVARVDAADTCSAGKKRINQRSRIVAILSQTIIIINGDVDKFD